MLFDPPIFLLIHVVLSVLGVITGLVVVGGLMAGARLDGWTGVFLATTLLTSITGFGFPFTKVLPPHVVGGISLVALAVALVARYWKQLSGGWRATYVVTAVTALYLNVFVLIVQIFTKTLPLAALAPTPGSPAHAGTQLIVLVVFVWLGWSALKGFRR
ncbi:MAG TPA: hypothetical protein VK642_07600 [Burkholderiales bacterium]|nr:hypothetical protein [Burkholderiales bacterium]